jgi:N-carbamoylputrescine amidase
MEDCRISAVQCRPSISEGFEHNLAMMGRHLERAAGRGVRFVVFPEVMLSGYVAEPRAVRSRALRLDSPVVEEAVALSGRHDLYCCFGMFEADGAELYNTAVLAGEGRRIGVYRKVHIPDRERGLFSPGNELKVFELPFARVGIGICFDNEICETHATLAVLGAELILMPAAWADHWEREDYIERSKTDEEVVRERKRWMTMMFGARCRDTGTYSVLVNQCGVEAWGPWRFPGKSMVFAPTGRVLAEARAWEEDVLYADLDAQVLARYRAMPCYTLRERRPGAYRPLLDESLRAAWQRGTRE